MADLLLEDKHDLVQKGYGWMLKVLSQKEPQQVEGYLECQTCLNTKSGFSLQALKS
ncbi:DNA alkylation repair protein [Vibrio chagasii]|nr:DNA alkylation repair protein [Vibrio chagasii]